jgi:signal transduction histidine kinase
VVLGVWSVVAALEATQVRVHFSIFETHHGWGQAWLRSGPSWAVWAASTPLVVWMARRYPLERGAVARRLAVHAGAALLLGVAHAPLLAGFAVWSGWTAEYDYTTGQLASKYFVGRLHLQLLLYAAIAGIVHTLEYQRRFRERELAASEMQARLAQAQLHALQGQIHPHFLFNTLNAVSVLVLRGDSQCAVRMISRLSELLRATLEMSSTQETTLRDEMALLGRYLDIERVRFGDRLTIDIDIPPAALDAMVPSLVLQPLVENAVRHGIAEVSGPGSIVIRALAEDGRLRLEVRDTGVGLRASGKVREGIGLGNTRARLAALYGPAGRLELAPAPGGGAVASVELPLRLRPGRPRPTPAMAAVA